MQSDIYSLAMVVIEVIYRLHAPYVQALTRSAFCSKVFTGKVPFPNATNVHVVIMISRGERPQKPPGGEALGLGPALWRLTEECWNPNPERRPDIVNVLRRFQAIVDTGLWAVFFTNKKDAPMTPDQIGGGETSSPVRRLFGRPGPNETAQGRINKLDQVRSSVVLFLP